MSHTGSTVIPEGACGITIPFLCRVVLSAGHPAVVWLGSRLEQEDERLFALGAFTVENLPAEALDLQQPLT